MAIIKGLPVYYWPEIATPSSPPRLRSFPRHSLLEQTKKELAQQDDDADKNAETKEKHEPDPAKAAEPEDKSEASKPQKEVQAVTV